MPKLLTAALILFPALLLAGLTHTGHADSDEDAESPIKVLLAETTTEFPAGIHFRVRAESDSPITSVAVRLRSPARSRGVYEPLTHRVGKVVDATLFWWRGFGSAYIPPGALLHVNFEIEDEAGNFHETGFEKFVYEDTRFDWEEVSSGPVTVSYHGPVKRRANDILDTMVQTLETVAPVLGTDASTPIRATMYNNYGEMLGGLPPWTRQVGHGIITEGQAFTDFNTLLILGSSPQALGTAAHEAVHILTHQAGDGLVSTLPAWLDEGLAEFGNPQPGYAYDIALEFAIETDALLPAFYMRGLPAGSEEIIIFYGQAKSIVSYMIDTFGPARIRALLSQLKNDVPMEDALNSVYGFGVAELDNLWRRYVGAPDYVHSEGHTMRPAAQPLPTVEMYSLDTRPVAPELAAPSVEPAAIETQEPDLDEETAAVETQVSESDEATEVNVTPESGGCNAGPAGAAGMMDVSAVALAAWVLALAALRLRRRTLC